MICPSLRSARGRDCFAAAHTLKTRRRNGSFSCLRQTVMRRHRCGRQRRRPSQQRCYSRIAEWSCVKRTPCARPVFSLAGAAFSRLGFDRPRAISLIDRTRGAAIEGILEAVTTKSSRRARSAFLASRKNALPGPFFYRAPWVINSVNLPGSGEHGSQRQSGDYQFSHGVPSPHPALYASGARVGYHQHLRQLPLVSSGGVPSYVWAC
jgi:hypothetical protein